LATRFSDCCWGLELLSTAIAASNNAIEDIRSQHLEQIFLPILLTPTVVCRKAIRNLEGRTSYGNWNPDRQLTGSVDCTAEVVTEV
jgi:hypothetical protein